LEISGWKDSRWYVWLGHLQVLEPFSIAFFVPYCLFQVFLQTNDHGPLLFNQLPQLIVVQNGRLLVSPKLLNSSIHGAGL
jgi:hypothetical protein